MAELPQCPIGIFCPGTDFPISNFSSEASDGPSFIGLSWPGGGGGCLVCPPTPPPDPPGWGWSGGGGGGVVPNPPSIGGGPTVNQPPILGSDWFNEGCFAVCVSAISQANANLCAQQQAELCTDPTVNTADQVIDSPTRRYFNSAQQSQFSCGDGTFNVFTVPAGTFLGNSQQDADNKAMSFATWRVTNNRLCCLDIDGHLCMNEGYNIVPITMKYVTQPPLTFAVTGGMLPPGMDIVSTGPTSAAIEGTPSAPGNYVFEITIRDAAEQTLIKSCSISVMGVASDDLPGASEGVAYSAPISVIGGTAPYAFVLGAGTLPSGFSLSAAGVLSGTPSFTSSGNYSFGVTFTDDNGRYCSQIMNLSVANVTPCVNWPGIVWDGITVVQAGTGSGSVVGLGNHALARADVFALGDSWNGDRDFSVTASGMGCHCRVTFVWDWVNVFIPTHLAIVNLYTTGDSWVFDKTVAPGTYVFNFIVNAFIPITINGDVIIQCTGDLAGHCELDVTFEVIP